MKIWIPLLVLVSSGKSCIAGPLQLHNRIVFTTGNASIAWTMNADGGDRKRVWRVPFGYGQFGGFSRDGKQALSFNRYNMYVHDLATKRMRHILLWSGGWSTYIEHPSFSPDGKQILCEVGSSNQNSSNSWVLRLETGKSYSVVKGLDAQELRPVGEGVPPKNLWSEPRWRGDGHKIVVLGGPRYSIIDYYSRSRPAIAPDIWTMNADGTNPHQVTKTSSWEEAPIWSPDGKTIVFVRQVDTGDYDIGGYTTNLWSVDLATGTEKQLTFWPETRDEMIAKNIYSMVAAPLFSPSSAYIAFEQGVSKQWDGDQKSVQGIYRMDADGKNQKRLGDGTLVQWVP